MKKILFLIDNLGGGGAEKVLLTLVNGLCSRYDITVQTIFDQGDYRNALDERVRYLPGFSRCGKNFQRIVQRWMKYSSAKALYRRFIRETYECEIAFLEGASTKIISGGTSSARRIAWVHTDLVAFPGSIRAFYPTKQALEQAYNSYEQVACVSQQAADSLRQVLPGFSKSQVVYNPVNVQEILENAKKPVEIPWIKSCFTFCTVGRMVEQKGFDRLLEATARLKEEGFSFELLLFGVGRLEKKIKELALQLNLEDTVRFLGFSPRAGFYVNQCDAYVCSSLAEGFSLSVAEALILGVPVISTDCTGPRELLADGAYGILVENSTQGIYSGMKKLLEDPALCAHFREKAAERQDFFDIDKTYRRVCDLIEGEVHD